MLSTFRDLSKPNFEPDTEWVPHDAGNGAIGGGGGAFVLDVVNSKIDLEHFPRPFVPLCDDAER